MSGCAAPGCEKGVGVKATGLCRNHHLQLRHEGAFRDGGTRPRTFEESFPGLVGKGNFRDTGCEVSRLCQACPLPLCKEELTPYELAAARMRRAS